MNFAKNKIVAVLAALTVTALNPVAAFAQDGHSRAAPALGNAAQAAYATHMVVVGPSTKSVNVDQDDVVTFDVAGKSFTWQFATLRAGTSFDLAEIAPEGVDTHGVRVYVAPNPLYRN